MLNLEKYREYIAKEREKFPHLSLECLSKLLSANAKALPTKRKEGEYVFIPISGYIFIYVILFTKLYCEQHYKKTKNYTTFIDLGAGNGQTSVITNSSFCLDYLGIEKYPLRKYNKQLIRKGDFLRMNTFRGLKGGRKIYYAYNPLVDNNMMYNALMFWTTRILEKGDILIYIKTSYFEEWQDTIFYQQFKKLISNIYIYEKE